MLAKVKTLDSRRSQRVKSGFHMIARTAGDASIAQHCNQEVLGLVETARSMLR